MERGNRKKILIVDDEQAVRDLFIHTLGRSGLDVAAAANAEEGIEAAKHMEPDIIFLSLLFPESNGLKVSKSLHSIEGLKDVPIVVLISYAGELDPKYTRTIGIVDVLVKPLSSADIIETTERLLGVELSSEGGESAGGTEGREEAHAWDEEADLVFAEGPSEGLSEEPAPRAERTEEESVEAADVTEEEDFPPGPESADEKDTVAVNVAAGEEEHTADAVQPDARDEGKEEDIGGVEEEGRTEKAGGDGEDHEPPYFEWRDEKAKRPIKKYILFAALTLLVAVAVFVVLQSAFSPGVGSEKLASETVKETPVNKEVPQAREKVKAGAEDVKPQEKAHVKKAPVKKTPAGKALTASRPSAVHKAAPSAKPSVRHTLRAEAKTQNAGLKGPRAVRAKQKEIYSVQVGAFGKEANAVSFARRLRGKGLDAFVEKSGGSRLHRVLIGKFDDYGKARRQSEVLLKKDGIKSVIYRH